MTDVPLIECERLRDLRERVLEVAARSLPDAKNGVIIERARVFEEFVLGCASTEAEGRVRAIAAEMIGQFAEGADERIREVIRAVAAEDLVANQEMFGRQGKGLRRL